MREAWLSVIDSLDAPNLFIGGKSMGGRIASLIADDVAVKGLLCLGYPFHPSGKPDKLRTEHLRATTTPSLFVQGERDALGSRQDVAGYSLSSSIEFHWMLDGDHSFKPRKASGQTQAENWGDAIEAVAEFVRRYPR